jgi:hypothetical protein
MIEIINKVPYKGEAEDLYFCINSKPYISMNLSSFEKAKTFSIENCYSDISFGVHKAWALDNLEYSNLIKIYPEIELLRSLQK